MGCQDSFGRTIDYLRVSVTDRCNLRCVYCMPPEGVPWRPHDDILRYEEIARVVTAAAELGINKVRLTGGEPLVRPHIRRLVEMVSAIPNIADLSMTTNGTLLAQHAASLAAAGLQRVNISLDTLRPERFRAITRGGKLAQLWAGVTAAEAANLLPIKFNAVVVKGLNDDEILDLARLTLRHDWHVRFIELMPIANGGEWGDGFPPAGDRYLPMEVTRAEVERLGKLRPATVEAGVGPAQVYRLPGAWGTVGFISPISEHICERCNRLRLTADGRLRTCLLSAREIDLHTPLRAGISDEGLQDLIRRAILSKPAGHHLAQGERPRDRVMSQIGG
jgi:cyclic pyranopterin phosphate synthase